MHSITRGSVALSLLLASSSFAGVITYGDKDVLGTGSYSTEPTTGATLEGLAAGVVTAGAPAIGHGFPFDPDITDYAGTDQIYVGSSQTGNNDGYSGYSGRKAGAQVISMDYSSLLSPGDVIASFTLGIAFDDFQKPAFGNPFRITVNGQLFQPLTTLAESLSQTGPLVQFYSIGLPLDLLLGSNVLTLSIDQGGNGGDGWAIDFLTVGVTVPTPGAASLLALGGAGLLRRRRTRQAR